MKSRLGKFLVVNLAKASKKQHEEFEKHTLEDIKKDVKNLSLIVNNTKLSVGKKNLYNQKIKLLHKIIEEKEKKIST